MSEQVRQIAARIKDLREISGRSADDVAGELGIPAETYLKYENGDIDIPVGILYKLSGMYNVELTAILTGEDPRLRTYCLVRKGKGVSVDRVKPYKYQSLAYNFINKKAEVFSVCVEPTSDDEPIHLNSHPGQEFNYVLEGTLMIYIDGHQLILNEGDSLYFDSGISHGMKALGGKRAVFLAVIV